MRKRCVLGTFKKSFVHIYYKSSCEMGSYL